MACFLYLKSIHSNLISEIATIYKALFGNDKAPTNLDELGAKLQKEHADSLLAAYRIEALIKNFMQLERPKQKIVKAYLDYLFSLPNKKTNNKLNTNEIELAYLYHPFSDECLGNFLLFHQSKQDAEVTNKTNKIPKCMRRL